MSFKIQVGDLVWAKVKGYPWWPGMVRICSQNGIKGFSWRVSAYFLTISSSFAILAYNFTLCINLVQGR